MAAGSTPSRDPLPFPRNPKTCFRFPLHGRAAVANLQMNTNLFLSSHLVMQEAEKDFPPSNDPEENQKLIA